MSRIDRYPVASAVTQVSRVLDLNTERLLRRAGLPADHLGNEGRGVEPRQFFRLWDAVCEESKRPDLPVHLGRIFSRGPFVSAMFAFSCSPDVRTGVRRLALFKPLVGPIRLSASSDADTFAISFCSVDREVPIPASMAAFELVNFLEMARFYTAENIVPLSVAMDTTSVYDRAIEDYFGMPVDISGRNALVLTRRDSERPLVSENAELWRYFEPQLRRQLAERQQATPIDVRVKNALLETLPAGSASVEDVCERLNLSRRSLQRYLRKEGKSFQSILDSTRSELSMHYLSRQELSIEEISYLLAYRDPNSFYRAFHAWTGKTPQQVRRNAGSGQAAAFN